MFYKHLFLLCDFLSKSCMKILDLFKCRNLRYPRNLLFYLSRYTTSRVMIFQVFSSHFVWKVRIKSAVVILRSVTVLILSTLFIRSSPYHCSHLCPFRSTKYANLAVRWAISSTDRKSPVITIVYRLCASRKERTAIFHSQCFSSICNPIYWLCFDRPQNVICVPKFRIEAICCQTMST